MIAIINGCGNNIASVQFALERLGKSSILTSDIATINSASHVILPGVGTANQAMQKLQKLRLVDVIRQLQQPVLGICLGMQLLYSYSQEGNVTCLDIIAGEVERLPYCDGLSLPHMGWNQLQMNSSASPLLKHIQHPCYHYYVHSYAAPLTDDTIASTQYGKRFTAIVQSNNFYGVQFHPERSGKMGEQILRNFIALE